MKSTLTLLALAVTAMAHSTASGDALAIGTSSAADMTTVADVVSPVQSTSGGTELASPNNIAISVTPNVSNGVKAPSATRNAMLSMGSLAMPESPITAVPAITFGGSGPVTYTIPTTPYTEIVVISAMTFAHVDISPPLTPITMTWDPTSVHVATTMPTTYPGMYAPPKPPGMPSDVYDNLVNAVPESAISDLLNNPNGAKSLATAQPSWYQALPSSVRAFFSTGSVAPTLPLTTATMKTTIQGEPTSTTAKNMATSRHDGVGLIFLGAAVGTLLTAVMQ